MAYFKNFQKIDYDVRGNGFTQKMVNLTQFAKLGSKLLDDITLYTYYTVADNERPDSVSYKLYGTTDYYWTFFLINRDLVNSYNDWPKNTADLREYAENKYPNLAGISSIVADGFDPIADKFEIGETIIGGVSGATGVLKQKHPTYGYITFEVTNGTFLESGEGLYGQTSNDFLNTQSIVKTAYAPKYWIDDASGERTARRTAGTSPYTNYNYEYDENVRKSKIKVLKKQYVAEVARVFAREMKNKAK